MPPRKLTIAELRRRLATQEKRLGKLTKERKRVVRRLKAVDDEIAAMGGPVAASAPKRRKKARKAVKKAAKKGRKKAAKRGRPAVAKKKIARKRAAGKALIDYLKLVLAKTKTGLRIRDAAKAVVGEGYKTVSKDFYSIVAATLRDTKNFKRVRRGIYKNA